MSRHFPRRAGGLTIIQTMAILAILGIVLFFALSLLKKRDGASGHLQDLARRGNQHRLSTRQGSSGEFLGHQLQHLCAGNA